MSLPPETQTTEATSIGQLSLETLELDDSIKPKRVSIADSSEEDRVRDITRHLVQYVQKVRPGLRRFFGEDDNEIRNKVQPHAIRAAKMVPKLVEKGCTEVEKLMDFVIISLYDVVMLLDNSQSMNIGKDVQQSSKTLKNPNAPDVSMPERLAALENTLRAVAEIAGLACEHNNKQGIRALRFLNQERTFENVTVGMVRNIVRKKVIWEGQTPIGTMLQRKVLKKFVPNMEKPVLVIIITDGMVEGEPDNILRDVILKQAGDLISSGKTDSAQAVSYQFAHIGDDEEAQELVRNLDDDESLSTYIDCMLQKDEVENSYSLEDIYGLENQDKKWNALSKLFLGAIHNKYDEEMADKDVDVEGANELNHQNEEDSELEDEEE